MFKKYSLLFALIFGMFTVVSSVNAEENARAQEQKISAFEKYKADAQRVRNECAAECQKNFPGPENDEKRYDCTQECNGIYVKSLEAFTESPAEDHSQEEDAQ